MRLIDADILYPDSVSIKGDRLCISQSQIANAPTVNVLDKIRAEIVDLGQRTMNDNRASGIWACRDIIDKYKAEFESHESVDKENNNE